MGRVADRGGIQFRVLNRRKGPAVRGPRAQADRKLYAAAVQRAIAAEPRLSVVEAEVHDLIVVTLVGPSRWRYTCENFTHKAHHGNPYAWLGKEKVHPDFPEGKGAEQEYRNAKADHAALRRPC